MGKKINQLDAASGAEVLAGLVAVADSTTGTAKYATHAQMKSAYGLKTLKYVATGAEGTTITPGLAGKDIHFILREAGPIFPVDASPDSAEYIWSTPNITLGAAVAGAGERFLIGYSEL